MKKLALLAGIALALCLGRPAYAQAQGPFADVPTDHWAYDAVNELAALGIFNGYPDSTFGGKRALTRYEFAVALQRMLQDVQRRIDAAKLGGTPGPAGAAGAAGPAGPRGPAGPPGPGIDPAELRRLQDAVATLQRLAREFSDTLAQLGTDVDQLKRDLAALADRVGKVEEAIAKMPKITGSAMLAFIGHDLEDPGNFAPGTPGLTDIDGRPLPQDSELLETIDAIYDIDLGITARLSDVATAKLLLNAGNYLKGYLNNSVSTVTAVNGPSKSFDQVTAYYLYLDAPISFGGFGANITVGKFGHQFTPYTLKMVDVDSYTNNDKTDSGDYPILGGRINFKLGGVNVQYYAGKHEEIDYADLTSTAGLELPPFFTVGAPLFVGNPDAPLALTPPAAAQAIDQSQGARVSFGVPLNGTLGITFVEGAGTDTPNGGAFWRRLKVWGADLNATVFKRLRVSAEVAQSEWSNNAGNETSIDEEKEKRAWDTRLGYRFGKLDLEGYYKRLGVGFDAPGNWGTIGRWKNPRGLEGFGGRLTFPLGSRASIVAEGADYRFIGLADTTLRHWKAGVAFGLTSSNRVDLGIERAEYDPPAGDKATEQYINIGWGHNFSPTTSFKLLYQIINFDVGDTGINPLADYDAAVAVTQFTVRF
jgi:uncharacterized coiled-coil protein SlyX